MSDNDSIKRGEVLNHLGDLFTLCSETGSVTERDLEIFKKIIKSLPPVPHEMTAREYGETLMKICASYNGRCWQCELGTTCAFPDERTIAIVEKRWAPERHEGRNEEDE